MQLTLFGIIAIGLWLASAMRGLSSAAFVTILMLPFGAAAMVNIPASGLSVLALQGLAALSAVLGMLHLLARGRGKNVRLPVAAWVFAALCVYGAAGAFVLPRLLFQDVLVVPYQRAVDGVRMSEIFFTTLIPLAPTPSNISQPGYLIASFAFFLVMLEAARLRGAAFISRALLAAGLLNALIGVLDLLRLDNILTLIRTADYAISANWSILGADRLIGGFPEPSAFGSVCAIFAAYGLSVFFDRKDWYAGLVGAANAIFASLALSSTGWFGLGVAGIFLFARMLADTVSGGGSRRAGTLFVLLAPLFVMLLLLLVFTPSGNFLLDLADRMIFSKAESASGLERGVWASEGYRVFRETFGFGAGLGSVRSNGIVPVLLSNVGWPGLLMSLSFVWLVFIRPAGLNGSRSPAQRQNQVLFRAAVAGAVTTIAMMSTTAVLVDPGILFFALAVIAISARARPLPASAPHIGRAPFPAMTDAAPGR